MKFALSDPRVSLDRGLGHVASAAEADSIEVEAISLDNYTSAFPAHDFLRCEAEGPEVEVFRGAQRLLSGKRLGIPCGIHGEENRRILLIMGLY